MAKEILLYGDIYSYSAAEFIKQLNDAEGSDISIRINTDGGDPEYGFGMVAKFAEHTKGKNVKVDGKAYSMGTFFCLYADDVEALNVSQFLVHRAAYPSWLEKDEKMFTPAMKENLTKVNASLRAAFEAKIDVETFEKIKKVTVDDIFSMENRIDVFLTAKEAEKIGLVNKIVNITPKKKAEIQSYMRMAAKHIPKKTELEVEQNYNIMTLAELKASHPEIFAAAVLEGINQERDRVGSWLPFMAADSKLVIDSIKEGKTLSATAISELNVKMFSANAIAAIAAGNAEPVKTTEVATGTAADIAKADKDAKMLAFRNEARANLGLPPLK